MKKILSMAMAMLMAFGGLLTSVGCSVKDKIVDDDTAKQFTDMICDIC